MLRSWAVQQAIYGKMAGDATLMSQITGVLDNPDQNKPLPYVTLGESTSTPDDLLIETGSQETLTLQIWDKGSGMARLKQIMGRIYTLLHAQQLTVSATQFVECRCELSESFKEGDGETRRGLMRFRIQTFG